MVQFGPVIKCYRASLTTGNKATLLRWFTKFLIYLLEEKLSFDSNNFVICISLQRAPKTNWRDLFHCSSPGNKDPLFGVHCLRCFFLFPKSNSTWPGLEFLEFPALVACSGNLGGSDNVYVFWRSFSLCCFALVSPLLFTGGALKSTYPHLDLAALKMFIGGSSIYSTRTWDWWILHSNSAVNRY